MLQSTKMHHWRDWLEKAEDLDIWTVNKILAAPATDGGTTRIPVLKYTINGAELIASTNEEKGQVLAKSFFPAKPPHETDAVNTAYPMQCDKAGRISKEVIVRKLHRLKPYKAPGPDGIPSIVLTKCADLLVDSLHQIYSAIYDRKLHYEPWKQFTTIVLHKPGQPKYDVPKAYRPIALINTMWKGLMAIIADQLKFYAEKNRLLLDHHFGGRLGRTTPDAFHLLTSNVTSSWRTHLIA